ncbi:hypothetical protein A9Q89_02610 [Gammaproteobacteria bacterium 53_120_T64]|nr:hypothetical protein A9Q89_02610 [Gammaproteobacteria bacterium 53_120_T64]
MNKDEALNKFIKDKLSFLTSGEFDRKLLKTYLKDYFVVRYKKKYGILSNSDVCDALVKYQIKYKIDKNTIIDQISIFPIFSYIPENKKKELISLVQNNYESGLSDDELNRIEKLSTIEAVKELRIDGIEKEIRDETTLLEEKKKTVEEELKAKQDESLSFNSVLDSEVFAEPEFNPEIEYVKQWWERFYLKKDPFPGNKDGLSRIEESLYEEVVSKSQPYIELLNKLERNPDYLFHTSHLLIGDFGFGKTTFQDYLIHYLTNKDILPIRITCLRDHPDSNGFHDNFIVSLKNKLLKNCEEYTRDMIDGLPAEEAIIELSKSISEGGKGIVIFLDDYHKFFQHYGAVFEFLGSLQPLKDELTRNDCNVGFVVSGVPIWERQLSDNRHLSGFFDSPVIRMPMATVEFILDVFNRRVRAYCYDSIPRTISVAFVENLFSKTNGKSSYRDYLNLIIEQLEKNNLSIVNTPIEIKEDILKEIKNIFEKDHIVGSSLTRLLKESYFKKFNQEQVHKCLELIMVVFTQEYVSEADRVFSDNKYYFSRLKECGFIQKRRSKDFENGFVWVVSKRVIKLSDEVREQFGFSMPDYFLKLFSHSTSDKSSLLTAQEENSSVTRLKADLAMLHGKIELATADNIVEALAQYERFDTDSSDQKKRISAVANMNKAFENLSNALYSIDHSMSYFIDSNLFDMKMRWDEHPVGNDSLTDTVNKISIFEKERDSISYSTALIAAKGAFEYLTEYIRTSIKDQVHDDIQLFRYRHNIVRHNVKDISVFETIKADMFTAVGETHFNYIAQITNHLETIFRLFLYASSSLCFGKDRYATHIADKGAVSYAHKNKSTANVASFHNVFSGFTRPQYRQAFTQGGAFKELIIKKIDVPWTTEYWDKFFTIFIEENISTSHQKKSDYSTSSRERYIIYCNLAQQLIGAMNNFISTTINESVYISANGNDISECQFKVGYIKLDNNCNGHIDQDLDRVLKKNEKLEEHVVNVNVFSKIKENIMGKLESQDYFTEDLLDIEYIQNHYGYTYHDFIFSLSYLYYIDNTVTVKGWFGSQIIVTKKSNKGHPSIIHTAKSGPCDVTLS